MPTLPHPDTSQSIGIRPQLSPSGVQASTDGGQTPISVVLDTNVLLDLCLFDDPRFVGMAEPLRRQQLRWLSTAEMREEFRRVLDYDHLAFKREQRGLSVVNLLAFFDQHAHLCEPAPKAPCVCKDPDDQKFIDLAVAHQATLYSKDKDVLALKNRLALLGIEVRAKWEELGSDPH
jgi:putative PIN family toxin of toxin-antitoxin system